MDKTTTSALQRYPLRSAHSGSRVLRSASTKDNKACSEPLNDSAAAQSAVKKRKSVSSLGSPNNSVRVLRSALKNKDEACGEPRNDTTSGESAANKRKGVSPSKMASPNNKVRVLRSASKNKEACSEAQNETTTSEPAANKRKSASPSKVGRVRVLRSASKNKEVCSEPLNDTTASESAANKRKSVSPSKVGSPNSSVRVLRSASKNKSEASSEPDSTVAHPAVKKRKGASPSKVGSPVGSTRVLRSTSKTKNDACNDPLNDSTVAQPAARKRKGGRPSEAGSPALSVRVLRSASKKKNDVCSEPLNDSTAAEPAVRKRKSVCHSKERSPKKDYLKICQRVRYILNRMNYEQSLIQAYASEGWKGQSLEKIRPEKELERAKAEILRCKSRIREAFRHMDSLLSEGKLEESLFDSAGEIYSEDIFCAVCGSKEVTLQNDIILCDGACDRGFHQNCLNPPLLTENIPAGDEWWFCPACVCKIDCIEALNELHGSKLSVHDSWEKVFPEAASLPKGSKQNGASNLLSDNLEDSDCNHALAEGDMLNADGSAEDEGKVDDLGLPSEDSEDDDFDPAGPDSSENKKMGSNSEESDFTSDSDDFCAEIAKSRGQDDAWVSSLSDVINNTATMKTSAVDNHFNGENSYRVLETELEEDMVLPISSRRQVERLDYKKLYDEAYGEESSNSSDDEEWSGKEKLEDSETDESFRPAKRLSRRASAGSPSNQHTPKSERLCASVNEQQSKVLHSNGSSSTVRKGHFGPIINQKLKAHFAKEPYPSRATKESLAQELGLTFNQVNKWFSSTRHYSRVSASKKGKHAANHTTENNDISTVNSEQVRETNDGVMEKLITDRNAMVYKEAVVQIDLNEANKEDTPPLSGAEIRMEASGKEPSYSSDDEEWPEISTPQKEIAEIETHTISPAKRRSRREPTGQQNSEHTQSEWINSSVNEQKTEALNSNDSGSAVQKYHFGPVINQKLKVHFEKDPYPTRTTIESLAQELGLTLIQVRRWFSSTRHYSSAAAAKKEKYPGNHAAEKNDSTSVGSIHVGEPGDKVMEKVIADKKSMVPKKLKVQINLDKGDQEDIPFCQYTSFEQRVITTPTAITIEAGPPGYAPGDTQGNGASHTSGEQRVVMIPTTISRDVGPPGYNSYPGEIQSNVASRNTGCEQRAVMTPTTISREVGPPGYGPRETLGIGASRDTSCEQRVVVTPIAISREVGPPGYGPGKNQSNCASRNTSCEQRVFMNPTAISGDFGPPGFGPGESQGNSASRNTSSEQSVLITPTTASSQAGPPGYWSGENQGNGASRNVGSPNGRSAEKVELADEARKKAIQRELRRMKKFR
ncbi:hypothetical protein ACP70R_036797 [Stipagrostis hirtigluma subsp. patula]